ncbi:Zinc finger protein 8 [Araneus ventricosus]|uniref:Zinc finger protein 8 n=1 Tax=Araneus ventricosus TaxID=182803 RepID=A0A4Y2K6C6_ARAVE|nr:Zinc finger protein 8 [Araneus ventricosus]
MDHNKSQSCPNTFSNSGHKKHSSNEEDDEVFSLSEMNELENFLARLDEMPDNLDLYTNDDVGNICLESQQYRISKPKERTSQLTENDAILLHKGNPLAIWPSSCLFGVPPYVSDDKEEEIGNYSTTLESVASASHIIKSNSNSQIYSSNEEKGEVFSLSEMNELEICLARPDKMADNLDLHANDDVGNICLESQQCIFGESEQGAFQLTENNANFSNVNTLNENAASNLAPDCRFILLQQGNPIGIHPSSCLFGVPPYVSDDKEEGIGNYSTTSENVASECDITKSNIYGYIETFQSTLHEQNEVRSSTSITYKSTDNAGNSGFSHGQRDEDEDCILQKEKELQNNILPGEVSKASDNRSSEFCNSGELLVPVNEKCTVISPSSTNAEVQWHVDDGRFVCPRCRKGFGRKYHLVLHYRTHTGEKPFACDKCGKRFCQSSNLSAHRRTHTGEKPFACDKCGRRFGQSNDLTRHRRSHTGEKHYKCSICGKAFTRSSSRNYHYKNVHNQK